MDNISECMSSIQYLLWNEGPRGLITKLRKVVSASDEKVAWMVGCFGFNGPLRQYFSLYRAVSQREGERREKRIDESKNITPTRTYYKCSRPLPYCNPNYRTPRHWKFTQHHHVLVASLYEHVCVSSQTPLDIKGCAGLFDLFSVYLLIVFEWIAPLAANCRLRSVCWQGKSKQKYGWWR